MFSYISFLHIQIILLIKNRINRFTILGTLIIVALFCICVLCRSQRTYVPFIKKYFRLSYTLMSAQRENKAGSAINKQTTTEDCVVEVETAKVSV